MAVDEQHYWKFFCAHRRYFLYYHQSKNIEIHIRNLIVVIYVDVWVFS